MRGGGVRLNSKAGWGVLIEGVRGDTVRACAWGSGWAGWVGLLVVASGTPSFRGPVGGLVRALLLLPL